MISAVPENLAKVFRQVFRLISTKLVKANEEILSGRKDSRNLSLPRSRSLAVSILHQKLGLETKARIERNHFLDALNGTITWERVDKAQVQVNIKALLKDYQEFLKGIKSSVPGDVEICLEWYKIKQARTVDQHGLDNAELLKDSIDLYEGHLALGDVLESEHEQIYRFFKFIVG